jgi:hypothetical protein
MSQTKEWMEEAQLDLEGANYKKFEKLTEKAASDEKLKDVFLKMLAAEITATDVLLEQLKLNYLAVRAHKEFLVRQRAHAMGDRDA